MEIVLQNIGKQFKNGTRALDHVTFTIPQGEFVSVIGPSGAGKTTLFRILNGMETPVDGAVLFDGSDISSMSGTARKNVKRSIGTIYQDFALVEPVSCRQNVLNACLPDMALPAALLGLFSRAQIAEAERLLARVGLADKCGEPVCSLSGGQKQRLAIARAIAKNPKIYVFDDSFSALDMKTDAALRRALETKTEHTTVIIVAQRISTILHADQILVLDDGKIVGKGTHEELLHNCEVYEQIARSQLSAKELGLSEEVK